MTEPLGAIRVRLYLDGRQVQEGTHEITDADGLRHLALEHSSYLISEAEKADASWMVEVEILNDPTDPERFMRFGTDPQGMHDPRPLPEER